MRPGNVISHQIPDVSKEPSETACCCLASLSTPCSLLCRVQSVRTVQSVHSAELSSFVSYDLSNACDDIKSTPQTMLLNAQLYQVTTRDETTWKPHGNHMKVSFGQAHFLR
jgi:hypothetical protein